MKTRNLLPIGLVAALLLGMVFTTPAFAQDKKMTYEEYQAEVQRWQQREDSAKQQITQLQGEIDALRGQISDLENQISAVWQEIYDMLGVTKDELQTYANNLDALASKIADFAKLTPEQIYQQSAQLDSLEAQLKALEAQKPNLLSQYMDITNRLEAQIASIRARMAKPKVLSYTVVRGDYLWKIAAKKQFYGDGMKWMRIYSVNHDQIKDPDLIFPNQKFNVPMDIDKHNQYLVGKGDYLYGIAESVYNDPFQWRKLYEANKDLISDPNYIVPEMILKVPAR